MYHLERLFLVKRRELLTTAEVSSSSALTPSNEADGTTNKLPSGPAIIECGWWVDCCMHHEDWNESLTEGESSEERLDGVIVEELAHLATHLHFLHLMHK